MHPLPHPPRSFRELVESDLRRAARLIVKVQDEIDWQFRIATPEGDYHLAVTMPTDDTMRTSMLRKVETFLDWKRAIAFTLAVETVLPLGNDVSCDAVYALGVSKREVVNCMALIRRKPMPWTAANFGAVEWLDAESADPVLVKLLAHTPRVMTPKLVAALEYMFGATGRFPAVHISTGEVRGV